MSYFGVKYGNLRSFLGQKRDFKSFLGQNVYFLGHFGFKKSNFDHFSLFISLFRPLSAIFGHFDHFREISQNHPITSCFP